MVAFPLMKEKKIIIMEHIPYTIRQCIDYSQYGLACHFGTEHLVAYFCMSCYWFPKPFLISTFLSMFVFLPFFWLIFVSVLKIHIHERCRLKNQKMPTKFMGQWVTEHYQNVPRRIRVCNLKHITCRSPYAVFNP